VRALLQNGDTFIDVGANAGYFSLVAAKRVGNAGRVLSIEPYEPTLNRLKKNAELSEVASIISPHLIAASDKAGVAMLHVSLRNDGENSIFADVGLPVACKTGTVDQLVQHQPVHVIKIDAEGSEASVLSGMKETLNDNPEICLIIEWHPLYASSVLWKSLISRFTVYSIIESEVRFGLIPVESSLHVPRLRLSNLLCIPKHI
jgi:FkbM family methyltransferase